MVRYIKLSVVGNRNVQENNLKTSYFASIEDKDKLIVFFVHFGRPKNPRKMVCQSCQPKQKASKF